MTKCDFTGLTSALTGQYPKIGIISFGDATIDKLADATEVSIPLFIKLTHQLSGNMLPYWFGLQYIKHILFRSSTNCTFKYP